MNPRLTLLIVALVAAVGLAAAESLTTPVRPAPANAAPVTTPAGVAPTANRAGPGAASTSVAPRTTSASAPAPRRESSITPTMSFDAFRVIGDRNIFNAYRTGRRERSTEERAPRLDTISLVGTMDSDKGLRAFFDGSEPAYRKALRVGESVDKFKVTQISANVVGLERDGKPLSVAVGQQLRRPDGGDWTLVGEDVVRREAQARAAADAAGKIDPTAPPVIPADASDTLRKLMEARAKQLKQ